MRTTYLHQFSSLYYIVDDYPTMLIKWDSTVYLLVFNPNTWLAISRHPCSVPHVALTRVMLPNEWIRHKKTKLQSIYRRNQNLTKIVRGLIISIKDSFTDFFTNFITVRKAQILLLFPRTKVVIELPLIPHVNVNSKHKLSNKNSHLDLLAARNKYGPHWRKSPGTHP